MDTLEELIVELAREQDICHSVTIPDNRVDMRKLLRSLMNVRPPLPASPHLLALQDAELLRQLEEKSVVFPDEIHLGSSDGRLRLWKGDITRLKVDAIVNAANSQLLGCFIPLHACIDNAIHSAAGIQLRLECHDLMQRQGHEELTGMAKITRGYNLPATHVIHTVGPIIHNDIATVRQERQLASCYRSCLSLAAEYRLNHIAFCCISTGEFHFPNRLAAEIAVHTVREFMDHSPASPEFVVFNVFKEVDLDIYSDILKVK